ncbi:glycosyl transferase family 1 [Cytophagales bacterium WSM2-2]|nr:glycosyl transferase family 1 [Cytophagales bacterium WSM2-2]
MIYEAAVEGDPQIVPMELLGKNPRTHFYEGLIPWLTNIQPDIVLMESDPVSRLTWEVSRWAKKNKVPIVTQTYENVDRGIFSTIKSRGIKSVPGNLMIKILNYYMVNRVNGVLVVNEDSERIFKSYGYLSVVRIPLGYDSLIFFADEALRDEYRKKLKLDENTVLVAYFGRLIEQKGVHLLIHALHNIKDSRQWRLLLDNAHDQNETYARQIQNLIEDYQLNDRVFYFEADHLEIANYMRASDIVVAPSMTTGEFKEQYGRAVQEAMACGCVCIVSDSGHLKDLVGIKELVFTEGDTEQLESKLINLINDESYRTQLSESLISRAKIFLTVEAQAAKVNELIQHLKKDE